MSRKKTHEEFIQELESINPRIEVLSQYISALEKIYVRCGICGNEWKTKPNSLLSGSGCPQCANSYKGTLLRKTHSEFKKELTTVNPNVQLLSEYRSRKQKVIVKCSCCEHEWTALPGDLLAGHGCPKCGYEMQKTAQRKTHNQFVEQLAVINPNIILLDQYVNSHTKVRFGCRVCHYEWDTVPNSVLLGHGCSQCAKTSTSFLEQTIYQAFKLCLGDGTVMLRDRKTIGMELDIFIPSLNIAFEPGSWAWHKEKIARDKEKRLRCINQNIRLITIYTDYPTLLPPFDKDCYVVTSTLGYANWNETKSFAQELLGLFDLFLTDEQWDVVRSVSLEKSRRRTHEEFVEEVSIINPNIEVVERYKDNTTRIQFKCNLCGNLWKTSPNSILQKTACPICGRRRAAEAHRKTHNQFINELHVKNSNIEVVGPYLGSKTKVECICKICGNKWEARPNALLKGQGCPECGRKSAGEKNRKDSALFYEELKQRNSKVELLGSYSSSNEQVRVRCRNCGYEWDAYPISLLNGHGCVLCYGSKKRTQEEFENELLAINPSIKVIGQYTNANSKVEIHCLKCDHRWSARPHDLLRGHGCPLCAKNIPK